MMDLGGNNGQSQSPTPESIGTLLHGSDNKATPVDTDEVGIWDSVSGLLSRLNFANLRTWISTYFWKKSGRYTVASAATVDLSLSPYQDVYISGSTTITSFGVTPIGSIFYVSFGGTPILQYSANILLPALANIQTAVGDSMIIESDGTGKYLCLNYKKQDGTALVNNSAILKSGTYIEPSDLSGTTFRGAGGGAYGLNIRANNYSIPSWLTILTENVLQLHSGGSIYGGSGVLSFATTSAQFKAAMDLINGLMTLGNSTYGFKLKIQHPTWNASDLLLIDLSGGGSGAAKVIRLSSFGADVFSVTDNGSIVGRSLQTGNFGMTNSGDTSHFSFQGYGAEIKTWNAAWITNGTSVVFQASPNGNTVYIGNNIAAAYDAFVRILNLQAGQSSVAMVVGGRLKQWFLSSYSVANAVTVLYAYTLPANLFTSRKYFWADPTVAGGALEYSFTVKVVGNATSVRNISITIASQVVYQTGALVFAADDIIVIKGKIMRLNDTDYKATALAQCNTAVAINKTYASQATLPGAAFATTQDIQLWGNTSGAGSANSDIEAFEGTIHYHEASQN